MMDVCRVARKANLAAEKISAAYPERMLKISRLAREEDRLRSLAAGLLLCEMLGAPKILHGEGDKPHLADGPHFNLSHSGDYALLVVGDGPVGVDIEKWETWCEKEWATLSRTAFHENERTALAGLAPNGIPFIGSFFDIWTLKESYVKMLGAGLSIDPAGFAVKIEGWRYRARVESDPRAHLRLYELEGYSVALCAMHPNLPDKILEVVF